MGDQSLHVGGYSSAHVKVIIEVLYRGCNSLSKCCTQAAAQFSSARIRCGTEDNVIQLRPNGLLKSGAAIHYQNAVHKLQRNSAPQGSDAAPKIM